jgi:hypothetical protein
MNQQPWHSIFDKYQIYQHNFAQKPYFITAEQIKKAIAHFTKITQREFEYYASKIHGKAILIFSWV